MRARPLTEATNKIAADNATQRTFSSTGVELENAVQFFFSRFWWILVQRGKLFGSHFSVRRQWRKMFPGSRVVSRFFNIYSARKGPRPRPHFYLLLTVSQPLSSGSAQRARHCGLSKSVLLGAHWQSVCFSVQMRSYLGRMGTYRNSPAGNRAKCLSWVELRSRRCYWVFGTVPFCSTKHART